MRSLSTSWRLKCLLYKIASITTNKQLDQAVHEMELLGINDICHRTRVVSINDRVSKYETSAIPFRSYAKHSPIL
jgi:hypothetical protein